MGARGARPALGWHLAWGFCVGIKEAPGGTSGKRQDGDVSLSKNSDCYRGPEELIGGEGRSNERLAKRTSGGSEQRT